MQRCSSVLCAMSGVTRRNSSLMHRIVTRQDSGMMKRDIDTFRQTFEKLESTTPKSASNPSKQEHLYDETDEIQSTCEPCEAREHQEVLHSLSDIDECPNITQILCLSEQIKAKWKDVAFCLRPHPFQYYDIAGIEYEYERSLSDQSTVMLERWKKKHGRKATIRLLCETLLSAECKLHAEEVFGEEMVERVVQENTPNENVSFEYELFQLAKLVGSNWRELGQQLGLNSVHLDCIERDISATRERAIKMLHDWYCSSGRRSDLDAVRSKVVLLQKSKRCAEEEKEQSVFPRSLRDDKKFYGREKELSEIRRHFLVDDDLPSLSLAVKYSLLVIRGHGGIGKSSLAARYAVMFRQTYSDGVYLFNAESWGMLQASLRENLIMLGQQYSGSGSLDEMNTIFLYHCYQKSKVLLLYDNVEDFDLLLRVLPLQSSHLHVLVTTRSSADHEVLNNADCIITLEYLSFDGALTALFGWADRARPVDEDELEYARRLVTSELIHRLPLAIAHIGTFIRQTNMSCCDYYRLLKSQEDKIRATALNFDKLLQYFHISHLRAALAKVGVYQPKQLETLQPEMIYYVTRNPQDAQILELVQHWMKEANHVYLTWQFDIECVTKKNLNAISVLEFASVLASKNIPCNILQSMVFSDSDRLAPCQFSLCLTDLLSHTLISTAETNETKKCDVHHLVQLTVFQRLVRQPDRMKFILTHLAQYLLWNVPIDLLSIQCSLNNSKFVELIPHLYSVAEKIVTTKCDNHVCLNLLIIACRTAVQAGHFDVAFRLSEKNLEITESLCSGLNVVECERDEDKAKTLVECYFQMGLLHAQNLNFSSSQRAFSKAIDVINKLLKNSENYVDFYLAVSLRLFMVYVHLYQFDDAYRTYNHVTELSNTHSCDSVIILKAKIIFGHICQRNGQFRRAYYIYKEVMDEAHHSGKSNSTVIGNAIIHCSLCLMDMRDYCGAVEHLKQFLTILRQRQTDDNVKVTAALFVLSKCYLLLNDVVKATRIAEECLSMRRSIFDPHHQLVAIDTINLAFCYGSSGNATKAIEMFNHGIGVLRTHLPHSKEFLCDALIKFGLCYSINGMPRESLICLENSISEHRSLRCENQNNLAQSYYYIALNHLDAGDIETAEKLFKKSLSGFVPESFDLIEASSMLASCLHMQRNYSESLQLSLQIRSILMRNDAIMSESMARACLFIGSGYMKLSQPREAEVAFLESIEIYRAVIPAGNVDMAEALFLLGCLYEDSDNVEKAADVFEECVHILEQLQPFKLQPFKLQPFNHATALVMNRLSWCLLKQRRFSDMLPLLLRSRDILTKISPISEDMTRTCWLLATCYMRLCRWSEAEEACAENLRISEFIYQSGHPLLIKAEVALQAVRQFSGSL